MNTRSKLITALVAGSLAFGSIGTAMASNNSTRHVTSLPVLSVENGVIILVDGNRYTVPYGFDVSKLQPGDRVQIFWTPEEDSTLRNATMIGVQ